MVEGARLERGCAVTRTEGSNPSLSAIEKLVRKSKKMAILLAFLLFIGNY